MLEESREGAFNPARSMSDRSGKPGRSGVGGVFQLCYSPVYSERSMMEHGDLGG